MNKQHPIVNSEKTVSLHDQPSLKRIQVRDGVSLRPLENSDASAVLAAINADPSIRMRVTVAARIFTEEDVRNEVAKYKTNEGLLRYVIVEDKKVVGLISFWRDNGFFGQEVEKDTYSFGYFLNPAARGRGLVTDSLKALLQAAQESLRINAFIAYCEEDNASSIAVLENLGLKATGKVYKEPSTGWIEHLYEKKVSNDK